MKISVLIAVYNGEKYIASAKLTVSDERNLLCTECAFDDDTDGIISFSPVCAPFAEYSAHKSYSRLFVTAKSYDGMLIFKKTAHRNRRDIYMAVCVCDDGKILPFEYEISADNILPYEPERYIFKSLLNSNDATDYVCPITPFVVIKSPKKHIKLLIACGTDEHAVIDDVRLCQAQNDLTDKNKNGIKKLYSSVLHCTYADERIVRALLGRKAFESIRKTKTHIGVSALWKYGVSGDSPILTLDMTDEILSKAPPTSSKSNHTPEI